MNLRITVAGLRWFLPIQNFQSADKLNGQKLLLNPLLCVCKNFNNYFLRGLLTFKLNN